MNSPFTVALSRRQRRRRRRNRRDVCGAVLCLILVSAPRSASGLRFCLFRKFLVLPPPLQTASATTPPAYLAAGETIPLKWTRLSFSSGAAGRDGAAADDDEDEYFEEGSDQKGFLLWTAEFEISSKAFPLLLFLLPPCAADRPR